MEPPVGGGHGRRCGAGGRNSRCVLSAFHYARGPCKSPSISINDQARIQRRTRPYTCMHPPVQTHAHAAVMTTGSAKSKAARKGRTSTNSGARPLSMEDQETRVSAGGTAPLRRGGSIHPPLSEGLVGPGAPG